MELGSRPNDPLIKDLVMLNNCSARLRNSILLADKLNSLPFKKVSDYIQAGPRAHKLLLVHVENLGSKTARELQELIAEANYAKQAETCSMDHQQYRCSEPTAAQNVNIHTDLKPMRSNFKPSSYAFRKSDLNLGRQPSDPLIYDLVTLNSSSARLTNCITTAVNVNNLPFDTVSEYIRAGDKAPIILMRRVDNLGKKTANELHQLINDACHAQRVLVSLPNAKENTQTTSISNTNSGPMKSEPTSAYERLSNVLSQLAPNQQHVLSRRFGLDGGKGTLQGIANEMGVTRERVRQIEKQSIRNLQKHYGEYLAFAIKRQSLEAFKTAIHYRIYITQRAIIKPFSIFPGWFMLALTAANISVRQWLEYKARRFGQGWIITDISIAECNRIRSYISSRVEKSKVPVFIEDILSYASDQTINGIATLSGYFHYKGYFSNKRFTGLQIRAIELHRILRKHVNGTAFPNLIAEYFRNNPEDPCNIRSCLSSMNAHSNLFVELCDGVWAAVDTSTPSQKAQSGTSHQNFVGNVKNPCIRNTKLTYDDITATLINYLKEHGPAPLSLLRKNSHAFLPKGRSRNSIIRKLCARQDVFTRLLPGVWAMHEQIPSRDELYRSPPDILFDERQVEIYTYARYAGEPWGLYPLWVPEVEAIWSKWSYSNVRRALFKSLLKIIQPDSWPIHIDRVRWRKLSQIEGVFSIDFIAPMRTVSLPTLDQILKALFYLRMTGNISWISANRILGRRTNEFQAIGLLAILTTLGIVRPDVTHWQRGHPIGPCFDMYLTRLCREKARMGELAWDTKIGIETLENAERFGHEQSWVSGNIIQRLLRTDSVTTDKVTEKSDILAMLLDEVETAERTRAANEAIQELSRQKENK